MSDSIARAPRRRRLLVGAAGALVLMSGPLLAALFVTVLGGASTAVAAQYKTPNVLRINLQTTLDSRSSPCPGSSSSRPAPSS
jgi:hypothetical protein